MRSTEFLMELRDLKREPSAYNMFISEELKKIKKGTQQEKFREAVKRWHEHEGKVHKEPEGAKRGRRLAPPKQEEEKRKSKEKLEESISEYEYRH